MSQRAATALVFLVAALIGVVVLVGLLQKSLDPNAVGISLITLLGGIFAGLKARSNKGDGS